VPAKDVVWQGNDFNEWIYSPEKLRGGNTYKGGLIEFYNRIKGENRLYQEQLPELPGMPSQNIRKEPMPQDMSEVWKLAAQRGLSGVKADGTFDPEAKLNLIKYVKKWGGAAERRAVRRFFDITPEILWNAMQNEDNFNAEQMRIPDPSDIPVEQDIPGDTATAAGKVPPESMDANVYQGIGMDEIANVYMKPMMDNIEQQLLQAQQSKLRGIDSLPPDVQQQVRAYVNEVTQQDMPQAKLAATNYGQYKREMALLNYQKRYGFDDYLNMVFPYQFWYTRMFLNSAMRIIDKPAWYAFYARLRDTQNKMAVNGMPSRLEGKTRLPMPWMDKWMGGGLWIDPYRELFPFEQIFGQAFDQANRMNDDISWEAQSILYTWKDDETISDVEFQEAIKNHTGKVWEAAYAQARATVGSEVESPMNIAQMMMTPALWLQLPYYWRRGEMEKLSVMPITKTARGLESALTDTILEPLGRLIGMVAVPEEALRKQLGLSIYGEWGEFKINRQLANMTAEGIITPDQALTAMSERGGNPAYEVASKRVGKEEEMKTPLAPMIEALKNKSGISGFISSLFAIFGGDLFPEGELELRNLKVKYNDAIAAFKRGDTKAIERFFDENPEYKTRLAMNQTPQEILRNQLISIIWDQYGKLAKPNRSLLADTLGNTFKVAFLNKETRSYDSIPTGSLVLWARVLGAEVPQTKETAAVNAIPPEQLIQVPQWQPEIAGKIELYQKQRNHMFPLYYPLQQQYYSLPEGSKRKAFLQQFPELKLYWNWKAQYRRDHPELEGYFTWLSQQGGEESQPEMTTLAQQQGTAPIIDISKIDPILLRQLTAYIYGNSPLGDGAREEIKTMWESQGKPFGDLNSYLQALLNAIQ